MSNRLKKCFYYQLYNTPQNWPFLVLPRKLVICVKKMVKWSTNCPKQKHIKLKMPLKLKKKKIELMVNSFKFSKLQISRI